MDDNKVKSIDERAKEILENGPSILEKVDKSRIFKHSQIREFPLFNDSAIVSGSKLGSGGFSDVYEVTEIHINEDQAEEKNLEEKNIISQHNDQPHSDHLQHYEVTTAHSFMAKNCMRMQFSRYAIKRLKLDLDPVKRARGAIDLAIEIKYMQTFWHPNIVKMRGVSNTNRLSTETFIIMDRLFGTLEDKIDSWEKDLALLKGCCGTFKADDDKVKNLLKDRLLVAYDLTCAIHYLHENQLLYRDVKPENIGFDIRGDAKLFDFGLCKSLERRDKVKGGYGYNLTAKTGSIPYMAPEIALGKPYGLEADVFSFGVMLWEILTVDWAFNGFTTRDYFERVVKGDERLPLPTNIPPMVRAVMPEAWHKDASKRPNIRRIGSLIRGELEDISTDTNVINRTQHMLNRSNRSRHRMADRVSRRRLNTESSGGSSTRRGRESFIAGISDHGGGLVG